MEGLTHPVGADRAVHCRSRWDYEDALLNGSGVWEVRGVATVSGTLIAESLRVGATLEDGSLRVEKIVRVDCGDVAAGQPLTWTFLEFQMDVEDVELWTQKLSAALDDRAGWYCDFRSPEETFVVFAGNVFRYSRGDSAGRTRAAEHARSVGVPESQIDWPQ